MSNLMQVQNVSKFYQKETNRVDVIENISLDVLKKQSVAIMGESGVGKSTLLQIMGGLLAPSSGQVVYEEDSLYGLSDSKRALVRNHQIGFVFQFHYLLPEFTALENVMIPMLIANQKKNFAFAKELLSSVGLDHRFHHKPGELSGGEQQRVAIARAMMMEPKIILADEPTGNLDVTTSEKVSDVLYSMIEKCESSLVLVTHSSKLASKAHIKLKLTREGLEKLS